MWRSGTRFLRVRRILARSFCVSGGADMLCLIDIYRFLLRRSHFLRVDADGLISDTIQPETGPIIRNGLGAEGLEHVSFGRSQGVRDGTSLGQMNVEALH